MDYIVTFEDGSSAYLVHYGVKGMKWGDDKKKGLTPQAGGQTSRSTTKTSKERASKTADRIKSFAGITSGLKGSSSSAGGKTGKDNKKAANALNDKSKDKKTGITTNVRSEQAHRRLMQKTKGVKMAKKSGPTVEYSKGYLRKHADDISIYNSIMAEKRRKKLNAL